MTRQQDQWLARALLLGLVAAWMVSVPAFSAGELDFEKNVVLVGGSTTPQPTLTVDEGDQIEYVFEVMNNGDAPLLNISVTDDNGTPGDGSDDYSVSFSDLTDEDGDGSNDDLAPGFNAVASKRVTLSTPGTVTNTATATAEDQSTGSQQTKSDSATVTINDRVAILEMSKTADLELYGCEGEPSLTVDEGARVVYCFEVFNRGDAAALNVSVVDDNGTPGNAADDFAVALTAMTDEDNDGSADDIAPGGSAYASNAHVVTMTTPGTITNTATATAEDETDGSALSDSDSVTVTVNDLAAVLEITKTASSTGSCPGSTSLTVDEGDTVTYCYTVENTGTAAARDIWVTDDNGTPGDGSDDFQVALSGLTDQNSDAIPDGLAPGESATGSVTVTLVSPGSVSSSALAQGYDVTSGDLVDDSDSITVTVNDLAAVLEITKTASSTGSCPGSASLTVDEGDTVTYCYTVENTGTAAARDIWVTDDNGTPGDSSDDVQISLSELTDQNSDAIPDGLAPGESATGSRAVTLNVPGSVSSSVLARGFDVTSGDLVSGSDSITVTVIDLAPDLRLTKTVVAAGGSCPGSATLTVDEGATATYCYTVENIGNGVATGVGVVDDDGTPGMWGDDYSITLSGLTDEDGDSIVDDLAPGATATGSYTVVFDSPGPVTATASASGYDPTSSNVVSDADSTTVTVNDLVAELRLTKTVVAAGGSCPGSKTLTVTEGDEVMFCYSVQNIGDAVATGVGVVDDAGTPGMWGDDYSVTLSGLTDEDGDFINDDLAPGATASGTYLVTLSSSGPVTNTANTSGFDITSNALVADADSVTVTVTNAPPVIHDCPNDRFVANPDKNASMVATWTPPTATDPSGTPPTLVSTHDPGDTFPVGLTEVTYTATDAQGLSTTCSFDVIVENTDPPVVEIRVPEDGGVYVAGEEVIAHWTATSNVDLASVRATVDSGEPLDTSQGGIFRFRVTATDITGLSTMQSVTWTVLYQLRPPAGGGAWTEAWLCIDHALPAGERKVMGSVPISGVYSAGEPIRLLFSLCDVEGQGAQQCIASLSVTCVKNPDDDPAFEDLVDYLLAYHTFSYDPEQGGYFFELQTWGYEPGAYDLWIAAAGVVLERIRVEIWAPE